MRSSLLCGLMAFAVVPSPLVAQARDYPIIDVHVHAHRTPPPRAYCALSGRIGVTFEDGSPVCEDPLEPAVDGEALMNETLAYLERFDMYAIAMTQDFSQLESWMAASDRVFPSIQTGVNDFETNRVPEYVGGGHVIAIGELMTQYEGLSPDTEEAEVIWELAIKHDVPVGMHISAPGAQLPLYSASLGNPLLLDPVLRKYPELRLYLMHAGWPFLEETVSILRQHPNVYVDISFINWQMPRRLFYDYLQDLIDYGFGKRIMFGSDQNWPDAIPIALQGIEEAPFLSADQKRDILFANAVRFFRFSEDQFYGR